MKIDERKRQVKRKDTQETQGSNRSRDSLWEDFKRKRDEYAKQNQDLSIEKIRLQAELREKKHKSERETSELKYKIKDLESAKKRA